MNQSWLVDVAVPVPLPGALSYRVPEPLCDTVAAGYRVQVPFRGKTLWGIVMSDAYIGSRAGVRDLIYVDSQRRLLQPDIVELVSFAAHYYQAPLGEVVKLALPPGSLSANPSCYSLTPAGSNWSQLHPNRLESRLLRSLVRPMSRNAWELAAQSDLTYTQLRAWEDAGWIVLDRPDRRHAIPKVDVVEMTDAGRSADVPARALKQRQVMEFLQSGGPKTVREVNAHIEGGSATFSALIEKGWIHRFQLDESEFDVASAQRNQSTLVMTAEQQAAFAFLASKLQAGGFTPCLLYGVTGSGKTEVYLNAIERCLDQGKQALFLVPEISLTPMMNRRIQARFGQRLAILHSAFGKNKRVREWARVMDGTVDVVLGARSAVFAPLPQLGLIIVDEEHDGSYKQGDGVRYHARSLAMVRAHRAGIPIVLGSATPSLESWYLAQTGKIQLLTLAERANQKPLPEVQIIDMREEFKRQRKRALFSKALIDHMDKAVENGNQVMVLLNRRGYHSFMMCRKCGDVLMCNQCEVTLTYHKDQHRLRCHYCDAQKAVPSSCPACSESASVLQFFGEGTQQVEAALQTRYGCEVVDRLDRDRLSAKHTHHSILERFRAGRTRILVGTQMIAKGHDFPNVTVVGILNADMSLRVPDLRCAESTFQLITQVAGRSGRGELPGHVVVQTYMPEHYSIQLASIHDYLGFAKREMHYRERLFYPPYAHLVHVIVKNRDRDKALQEIKWLARELSMSKQGTKLVVLGPSPAPLAKVKNIFRFQILIKSDQRAWMHELVHRVVASGIESRVLQLGDVVVDVDPVQFS
ncbi:MAG: primosomal protein N' [Acidobacteria bacterium]|nr:primosomal protein N' [Acidobacteriota bacterium]